MRGLLLCMVAVFTSVVQAQAKPDMARLEADIHGEWLVALNVDFVSQGLVTNESNLQS